VFHVSVMISVAPGEHKNGFRVNFVKKMNLTKLESAPSAGIFLGPRPGVGISGLARPDRAAARPLPAGAAGPTQKHKAAIIAVFDVFRILESENANGPLSSDQYLVSMGRFWEVFGRVWGGLLDNLWEGLKGF
jgi:hypothetical protein